MVKFDILNYGYFDGGGQTEPKYDPRKIAPCLFCGESLDNGDEVFNTSFIADDVRCWFYYGHKQCFGDFELIGSPEDKDPAGALIDRIPKGKPRDGVDSVIRDIEESQ